MTKYKTPTKTERMKYEIAREIGLFEKVIVVGWAGLTSAESGRIGGILSKRLREGAPRD